MTAKIVGFQSGHDVAYCILENGIPVLCEELERFTRVKMQLDDGLKLFFGRQNNFENIKYFTFGNWGNRKGKRAKYFKDETSDKQMKKVLNKNNGEFYEFGHHTSHAANAFFTSTFEKALIITMDGGGNEDDKIRTSFAVFKGQKNKIERIAAIPSSELDLGGLWHLATREVFGLSSGYPNGDQAGSVMAMASLGKAQYTNYFDNSNKNLPYLKKIAGKSDQDKFNVAASLQKYTENVFCGVASRYIKDYDSLCLSGGVSLNCVLTGKIKTFFPNIKNIFCDPVPYDAGLSLGSARYLWHQVLDNPRVSNETRNISPYLGKTYSKKDVLKACSIFDKEIIKSESEDRGILKKIDSQKIVAVFGGGSETGRRALGNRSILADPRNPEMKKIINEKVKHRQWYRPLAPSILEERVNSWFENPVKSPYMSFALKYKSEKKAKVPAVVHFDGTGRLQTVNKKLSPWYYQFISKWEDITGIPMLVNTSFNDSEPIVETPFDAINCFLKTEIDCLYFYDYGILVEKNV